MKMKILSITAYLIITSLTLWAQAENSPEKDDLKKIQAMEVAYITKELNLSPEEAQKFWPVFNQYRNEVKNSLSDRSVTDHLEKQQKVLDIRKKYRSEFSRIITLDRANKVFPAEEQFRQLVRREFQKRQMERRQINPQKRGG